MSGLTRRAVALAFSLAIGLPVALAQDAQDSGDAPTAKKIDKTTKRKMKQKLKKFDNASKQGFKRAGALLLIRNEPTAFLSLQPTEERRHLIKQSGSGRAAMPILPKH